MRGIKKFTLRSLTVVATWLCTILVAGMQFTGSSAQQASDTKPDMSINSGVKPLGKRDIRDIRLSGWRKLCFEVSPAEKVCRTTNVGVMNTGQEMIRFDLIDAGAAEGRIQMLLPPGMYLRSGITLTVDHERAAPPFIQLVSCKRVRGRGPRHPSLCQRSSVRSRLDDRSRRPKPADGFGGRSARSVRVSP